MPLQIFTFMGEILVLLSIDSLLLTAVRILSYYIIMAMYVFALRAGQRFFVE